MTYVASRTETYSDVDIENVFRRFTADLRMIADSSGAITRTKAENYGYDVEYLAKNRYLRSVDVTFISGGKEIKAARYTVNTAAADLTPSRPGGVLWPRISGASLQVVISHTQAWRDLPEASRAIIRTRLKLAWVPTTADTSHSTLAAGGGRAFVSNAYGVERQDYS